MKNISLLILLIMSVCFGVQRVWNSSGSTDMNATANYTGTGAILSTDSLIYNNTSVVNAIATANMPEAQALIINSNYTGTWSDTGFTTTWGTGGVFINSGGSVKILGTLTSAGRDSIARGAGTGTLRLMNDTLRHTGDNAFYLAWPAASIDSSGTPDITVIPGASSANRYLGCYIDIQGSGKVVNQTGNDYISPKCMKMAYTGKADTIFTAQWHPWQLITGSGTINFATSGKTIDVWIYSDTSLQFTNTTFTGAAGLQLVGNYHRWTVPKIKGTVSDVSLISYRSTGEDTITVTDSIYATGGSISFIQRANGASSRFIATKKVLSSGIYIHNLSGSNDSMKVFIDSVTNPITASSAFSSNSPFGRKADVYLDGSAFNLRTNVIMSAWRVKPNTGASITYSVASACSHTNGVDNKIHKLILNKSTTSTRLTITDSLVCDSLVLTKGRLFQNGKVIHTYQDAAFNSATALDSMILSGPIRCDGNLLAISGAQFFFNAGAYFEMTAGNTHTITTGGKRLDTIKILGATTINGGDTLIPKITNATATFQTGQNFTFLSGYDIEGTAGNLDSIVGGNIDIPSNDSIDYAYLQNVTLAAGDTIWAGLNSIDGGGNSANIIFSTIDTIPVISSITPEQVGPGDTVTLAGTVFGDSVTVQVRNNTMSLLSSGETSAVWIATAMPEGPHQVIITNMQYGTKDTTTLHYDTIPALLSCVPDTGNFRETKNVTLNVIAPGGQVIDSVWEDDSLCTIVSRTDSTVVVTIPAHVEVSDVDVRSISKDGYRDTLPNGFTHVNMDTIPAMVSALPLYSKLAGGGHGTIAGTGMTEVDSVWYGDSLAVIDSATYTTLYTTIPAYGVRGGLPIRTHAVYGYRDTLLAGITYKNIHITSITPIRGVAGDTLDFHFLWGAGTSGLAVMMGDSAATVVAGYADTLARVVAPVHANGSVQVRAINGAGDTTFSAWIYGTANKRRSGFGLGLGTGWLFGF
jgi:hypothetical protein